MSLEIAWKQNILVTDSNLLKSLLVDFGFGSQAFICEFSRQNICSVHFESTLRIKMTLFDISDSVQQAPPSFAELDGGARRRTAALRAKDNSWPIGSIGNTLYQPRAGGWSWLAGSSSLKYKTAV